MYDSIPHYARAAVEAEHAASRREDAPAREQRQGAAPHSPLPRLEGVPAGAELVVREVVR